VRLSRAHVNSELRAGSRSAGTKARVRSRDLLVTLELALAVVLLAVSGLLARSFAAILRADRGYQSDHVLAGTVFIYEWSKTPEAKRTFIAQLVERLAAIPSVVAAGATSSLPLSLAIGADQGTFTIEGRPTQVGAEPSVHMTALTPSTFAVLRIPLRRGRLFTESDDASHSPVAIVSESMARRFWPGEDPIGKRLVFAFYGKRVAHEVVGIVADIRQTAVDAPVQPTLYVPHAQAPTGAMTLVLRTANDPRLAARSFKRAVAELNPSLPLADIVSLDELVSVSLSSREFALTLFLAFGASALVLAVIGVYAVVNQSMAERRKELGVRSALGAQPDQLVRMVMRESLFPVVIGLGIGLLASALLTQLVRGMLFSVAPLDGATFIGVSGVLLGTASFAIYIPAIRAARVDPLLTLRSVTA
jgi:putative ABC transport system permease protein